MPHFRGQLRQLQPYVLNIKLCFFPIDLQDDHSQVTLLSPASLATGSVTSQPALYASDFVERQDFSMTPTLQEQATDFDPPPNSTAPDTHTLVLDGATEQVGSGYAAYSGQAAASSGMHSSTLQQEQIQVPGSTHSEIPNGHASVRSLPYGAVYEHGVTLPLSERSQPADHVGVRSGSASRDAPAGHAQRPRPASAQHGHGHRNYGNDSRSSTWRDNSSEAHSYVSGTGSGGGGFSYPLRSVRPMSADTGTSSRPSVYGGTDGRSVYVAKSYGGNHASSMSHQHLPEGPVPSSSNGSGYVRSQSDDHGAHSSGAGAAMGGVFDGDGSSEIMHRQARKRRELELASRAARLARRAGSPIGITLLELDERDMLAGKLAQEVQDAEDLRAQQQGLYAGHMHNNYGGGAGSRAQQQQRAEQVMWDQALRNQEDERQRDPAVLQLHVQQQIGQQIHLQQQQQDQQQEQRTERREVSEPHTPPTPSPRQPASSTAATHSGARHQRDNNHGNNSRPARPPWGGGASAAARHVAEVRAAALANASAAASGLRTRNTGTATASSSSSSNGRPSQSHPSSQQRQQQSRTANQASSSGRGASATRPILSRVRRGMEVAPRSARKRGRDLHQRATAAAAEYEGNPQAAPVDLHAHTGTAALNGGHGLSNGSDERHAADSCRVTVAPTVGPLAAATAAARRRPTNTRPATATVSRRQEPAPMHFWQGADYGTGSSYNSHTNHATRSGAAAAAVAATGPGGSGLDYVAGGGSPSRGWVDFDSLSSGRPSREGRRPVSAAARVHMGAEWAESSSRGVGGGGRSGALQGDRGESEGDRGGPQSGTRVHSSVSDDDDSGILDGDLCDDDPLDGYASGSEGSGALGVGVGAVNDKTQQMHQTPLRHSGEVGRGAAGYSSGSSSDDDNENDQERKFDVSQNAQGSSSNSGLKKATSSPGMVNAAQLPSRPRSSSTQRSRSSSNNDGFGSSHAHSNSYSGVSKAVPLQRPMSAGWMPHGASRGAPPPPVIRYSAHFTSAADHNTSQSNDGGNNGHSNAMTSVTSSRTHTGMSGREGRVAAAGAQLWRAARRHLAQLQKEQLKEEQLMQGPHSNSTRNLAQAHLVTCFRVLFFDGQLDGNNAGQCGLTQLLECLANMNVAATLLEAKELLRWIAHDTNNGSGSGDGGQQASRPLSISVDDFATFVEGPEPGTQPSGAMAMHHYVHEVRNGTVDQHGEIARDSLEVDDSAWEVLVHPSGAHPHAASSAGHNEQHFISRENRQTCFTPDAMESKAPSRRKNGTSRSRARKSRASNRGSKNTREESHNNNNSDDVDSKPVYYPELILGKSRGASHAAATTAASAAGNRAMVSSVPRAELDDLLMSLEQRVRCVR